MNRAIQMVDPTDRGVHDSNFRKTIRDGEERLLLALLESATEDFQKYIHAQDKRGKELFEAAEEWFLATDDSSFLSFENVCEYLQLNPHYVRTGLMRWKAAHVNHPTKRYTNTLNAQLPPA
jgi:hypothetical protein